MARNGIGLAGRVGAGVASHNAAWTDRERLGRHGEARRVKVGPDRDWTGLVWQAWQGGDLVRPGAVRRVEARPVEAGLAGQGAFLAGHGPAGCGWPWFGAAGMARLGEARPGLVWQGRFRRRLVRPGWHWRGMAGGVRRDSPGHARARLG